MKTTFKTIICSAVLLTFVAGCGKKDEKSSSAPAPAPVPARTSSSLIGPGVVADGSRALEAIRLWHAEGETVDIKSFGYIEKSIQGSGFKFEVELSYCFFGKGSGCDLASGVMSHCYKRDPVSGKYGVTEVVNGNCDLRPEQYNYDKASNQDLAQAIHGVPGLELKSIQQNGTRFSISYGPANSFATKFYLIDTAYHSIINPVVIQDQQEREVTRIEGFRVVQ